VTSWKSGTNPPYREGETVIPGTARPLRELGPQLVHLAFERHEVAAVVDHPGRDGAALLVGRLGGHAGFGVGARNAASFEPFEAHLTRCLDDDHCAVVEPSFRLHEQRDVVHDHGAGLRLADLPQELGTDRRVRDRFEVPSGLVVDERLLRQRRPVERAVGLQDVGAEPLDELLQRLGPGLDDLPRDEVGVDHERAPGAQQVGDGGLPRTDAARQADHEHGAGL
jgi:hypothetical protein